MVEDSVTTLHGFAWYARNRSGAELPDAGGHPFDGVESKYRRLCWQVGPGVSGVRIHGPGPAFVIITPALALLTFGPPEVGQAWWVEPAELDGFRTEDGRIRMVSMQPHRTPWGTLAVYEFEATPLPTGRL